MQLSSLTLIVILLGLSFAYSPEFNFEDEIGPRECKCAGEKFCVDPLDEAFLLAMKNSISPLNWSNENPYSLWEGVHFDKCREHIVAM